MDTHYLGIPTYIHKIPNMSMKYVMYVFSLFLAVESVRNNNTASTTEILIIRILNQCSISIHRWNTNSLCSIVSLWQDTDSKTVTVHLVLSGTFKKKRMTEKNSLLSIFFSCKAQIHENVISRKSGGRPCTLRVFAPLNFYCSMLH